ncbi:anthranilate synthase component I [Spirochaetota bacterium]
MMEKSDFNYSLKDIEVFHSEGKYNTIPLYAEMYSDFDTPLSVFSKLYKEKYCFLLESITGGENIARYSFLGSNPTEVITIKNNELTVIRKTKIETKKVTDPFNELRKIFLKKSAPTIKDLPSFHGGGIGYISYDAIRNIEVIPDENPKQFDIPDYYFIVADSFIVFDHVSNKIKIVYNISLDDTQPLHEKYCAAVKNIEKTKKIIQKRSFFRFPSRRREIKEVSYKSNFDKEDFIRAVEKAKDYIIDGDIFQVVLSQRFTVDTYVDPFKLYRALRIINPSPYMFYLKLDSIILIGASPEILVKKQGETIEVRPIAGTRKRGNTREEDTELENELLADEKELAEHVMLVDLGRNDIGRVSKAGTVQVHDTMVIEKYAHVMHIVSSVLGTAKKDVDAVDAFRATFPAGTVSGAPKIRAMEIIDELENVRRGPYSGSVVYFSYNGDMDSCISIRTILIINKKIYLQAGAGIVYDSVPEKEFEETLNKTKSLFKAVTLANTL